MSQGKVLAFPSGPIELIEGKNLGNTVLHGIKRARRERAMVVVMRKYITSAGVEKRKPILRISPQGDVSEVLAPPLRVQLASLAIARAFEKARSAEELQASPIGRMMAYWEAHFDQTKRKVA